MRPKKRGKLIHRTAHKRERAPYSTNMKILLSVFILLLIALWVILLLTGVHIIGLVLLTIVILIVLIASWFLLNIKFVVSDLGVFAVLGPAKYRIAIDKIILTAKNPAEFIKKIKTRA